MNPLLLIKTNELKNNFLKMKSILDKMNILCFPVVKVTSGNLEIANIVKECEYEYIADSRIDNLILYKDINIKKVLIRTTELSRINDTVLYADISLESEYYVIKKLNEKAKELNLIHSIILMFDMGDLREGIMYNSNYLNVIKKILTLTNIHLIGIGTNFSCYGGVLPTTDNLLSLINIRNNIEETFNIKIPIISGGNSSSLYLVNNQKIPNEINNLRIGECIFLGHETAYNENIFDLDDNIFTLQGEIIEVKEKPSFPIGEIGLNAFGQKPLIKDSGIMFRAIVNIGKLDVDKDNLLPIDNSIQIIGQSSDHLIIDITKANYILGSMITFKLNYAGLMQSFASKYIDKSFI